MPLSQNIVSLTLTHVLILSLSLFFFLFVFQMKCRFCPNLFHPSSPPAVLLKLLAYLFSNSNVKKEIHIKTLLIQLF